MSREHSCSCVLGSLDLPIPCIIHLDAPSVFTSPGFLEFEESVPLDPARGYSEHWVSRLTPFQLLQVVQCRPKVPYSVLGYMEPSKPVWPPLETQEELTPTGNSVLPALTLP